MVAFVTRSRPPSRHQVVVSTALLVVAVLVVYGVDGDSALVRFPRWYASRFVAYYTPKIAFVKQMLRHVERRLPELPEDVYDAFDVSTAFIVVVSIFHLMERLRVELLAKIAPTGTVAKE